MAKRKRRQNRRKRRYQPSTLAYSGPAILSAPRVTLDDSLAWYAVWTASRAERKAELRLREAGFSTYLPSEAHLRRRRGAAEPVERQVIGRYLFVGLPYPHPPFGIVRDVEEIQGIVSVQGYPLQVSVAELQRFADELSGRRVVIQGGRMSRLWAIMDQADQARLRERGPFWSEAA